MGQCYELSADHIFRDGARHYFKFASVSESFDAQQLHTVANLSGSKERRNYLQRIVALLKRLDKRIAK